MLLKEVFTIFGWFLTIFLTFSAFSYRQGDTQLVLFNAVRIYLNLRILEIAASTFQGIFEEPLCRFKAIFPALPLSLEAKYPVHLLYYIHTTICKTEEFCRYVKNRMQVHLFNLIIMENDYFCPRLLLRLTEIYFSKHNFGAYPF